MYDLERDVWCLLGLIFDAVDMQAAMATIDRHANHKTHGTISTPNLNFLIAALRDQQFRDTVTDSQLSLLDGMPLLWVARLLETGITTKVSGSNLFEQLSGRQLTLDKRLRVFFLGGEEGVACEACNRITITSKGLTCVGFCNPGFGSIAEISSTEILDAINNSKADFLVVALGARKGQMWISKNRLSINVPVVSHLGAVVNFAAGTIKRAPAWMQRSGFEWTWRIIQEPLLWKRYFFDGLGFARLLVTRAIPYAVWRKYSSRRLQNQSSVCFSVRTELNITIIAIEGNCLHSTIGPLRSAFSKELTRSRRIRLDLSKVPLVDGAFLGLCILLRKHLLANNGEFELCGINYDIERIIRWNCAEYLL